MELVRAVEDARRAPGAEERRQRGVGAEPGRAVDLDGRVRDLLQHPGSGDLRQTHLDVRVPPGGDPVRRLVDQRPGGAQGQQRLEDVLLDELVVRERTA